MSILPLHFSESVLAPNFAFLDDNFPTEQFSDNYKFGMGVISPYIPSHDSTALRPFGEGGVTSSQGSVATPWFQMRISV